MKVAQAISRALVSEGVTLAAGIAGQSIWPVIDAIGDCEEVSLMYARQERVAFDICDGFARASGNPAVVFTDAGPAAANLMGGIVNSWGDSVPVLFLAGHNERTRVASKFTKEIPFLDIFAPVSKWAAMIDDPSKVAETLAARLHAHAHRAARPGRARRAASTSRRWRSAISSICRCRRVRACAAAPIRTRSARRSISSAMPSGLTSMSAPASCSRKRPMSWCASPSC